jgi:pyruvate/2-oxoacid:ferredoxin oxidoreductase alpha subunit
MCDLTILAFDLADKYRNPACVLTDGFIGQMMEPCTFPPATKGLAERPWAVGPGAERRDNLISSIYLEADALEAHVRHLFRKYDECERNEVRFEEYKLADAQHVVIGYGIVSRILKTAVDMARANGIKVGLLRPITLWPFPTLKIRQLADKVDDFLVVELSMGQMVEDVRLAVEGRCPVAFYGRVGGNVPTADELVKQMAKLEGVTHG